MATRPVVEVNSHVCVAVAVFAILLPFGGCERHDMTVEFYLAEGHRFTDHERSAIQAIADTTTAEVRRYLPTLPRDLVLKVQAGTRVIPETGETGYASPPNIVYWTVDPNHNGGVTQVVQTQLRASLFDFFHHLVRSQTIHSRSLMDQVVGEGMATAFMRDFAGASPPWAYYPDNAMDWVNELMALPPTTGPGYFESHERRWMRFKAGTYLVDQAMRSSGQSSAQLVSWSTDDVIRMALGR